MENFSFISQFSSAKQVFDHYQAKNDQNQLDDSQTLNISKHNNPEDQVDLEQNILEKAQQLFNQNDYKTAQIYFNQIVQEDSKNVQAIQNLALCNFYLKNYDEGILLMQKAIEMQPDYIDKLYYYLGCAYCDQKHYMQGLVYLEKAMTQNQNNQDAIFMLGNTYQNISCLQIAQNYYKKLIEIDSSNQKAHFQMGETHFKMQNYKDASEAYKKACKINPENYYFYLKLGTSQYKEQNLEEALKSLQQAVVLNNKFAKIGSIFYKLIEALVEQNHLEKCIQYYLKMFALNPKNASSYFVLGDICIQEKQIQTAKLFFEESVKLDASFLDGIKALGKLYFETNEFDQAIKVFEKGLLIDQNEVDIIYDIGCCLFELDKIQEATEQFRKAFRLNTISYEDVDGSMVNKGIQLQKSKENIKYSLEYFNFAILINSNNAEAFYQKGLLYECTCNLEKAKEHFEKALQIYPQNSKYAAKVDLFAQLEKEERKAKEARVIDCKELIKEAKQLFTNKEYQKCIEVLQKISSVSDNFPKVNEMLGYSYEQIGENEKASQHYMKALQLNPNDQTLLFNLGNCLFNLEKYDEAIEKYNILIHLNQNKPYAYENLAACYYEKKQYQESIQFYQKALEYNKVDPLTNYGLGKAFYSNNQYEEALKCFQITLSADHENPSCYTKLANTITMLKSDSLVGKIFKKNQIYTKDEKSRMLSLMAGVLYEMKQYQKSIEKCEQAINLDSKNFNAYLIKAASLKELCDFVHSLNQFEEAIKINPNDPDCYYFYGQTLEAANLHMKALEKYDKSIMLASQTASDEKSFSNLKQFQAAKQCMENVMIRYPQFQNYFNEIGNNLFEKNDFHGAIECYKQELRYNSNDYAAIYNMGLCYKNIQKINDAIECFQKNIINKHRESCLQMSKSTKIDYQFVEKLKLVSVSSMQDLQSLIKLELLNKENLDLSTPLEKQPLIRLVSQVQQIVAKKAANYEDDIMKLGQLNRLDDLSKVYKILLLTGLEENSIVVNVKPELMLVLIGQQLIFFNNSVNLFYSPLKLFDNIIPHLKNNLKDVESFLKLGNGGITAFKQQPIFPQEINFLKAIISQCLSKFKNSWRYISLCMNFKISTVYKIHFFQSIFRQKSFKPFLQIQKIENIFTNQSTNVQKINLRVDNSTQDKNIILKTLKSKNFDEAVKEYTFQNCITHRNIHSSYFFQWNEDQNNASITQPLKERNLYTIDQLTYQQFLSIMLDCCEGLQQLTFYNIVHADIKPQNIFYDNQRAQIADFGSCIVSNTQNNEYTPTFCSPESESFESGQRITTSSDIYSLGKTFQFIAEKFKLPCSGSIQAMILMMTEKEPTRRIRVHEQIKIIQCEIFVEFLYQCLGKEMSLQRFYEEISYIIEMRKKKLSTSDMIVDIIVNVDKVKQLIEKNKLFVRSLFNQKYLYVFLVIMSCNDVSEKDLQIKQKIDQLKEDFEQEAVEIEQSAINFLSQIQLLSPQEQYLEYLLNFNYEKFIQTIAFFDNINFEQAYLLSIYLIWKTNLFNISIPENITKELQEIDFMKLFKSFYKQDKQKYVNDIKRQKQISSQLIDGIFNTQEIQNQYKAKYEDIIQIEQTKLLEQIQNQQNNNNILDQYSETDDEVELESINSLSAAMSSYKDSYRYPGPLSCEKILEEGSESQGAATSKSFFQYSVRISHKTDLKSSKSQHFDDNLDSEDSESVRSLPAINIDEESLNNDLTVRKGKTNN
ncbi:tetratricopeptide repeat protein (macronuclear) [Tetrahymena thermophila SB210]|uniref:Tetratricopeptide repeat protein n=1 Tax=Tetrahymena thermophila (strain SB210) TaxID=312017 RepID=Q241R0_TETTS|nr:tetratricopeptide repeat protein [Tetrahymena thermophila SB210]EAS02510.1 tetratricopeptide repeat protein [Tetrahymena thermophila SB210]|eukprot:XP_001022755.1 tetratricopeptide repeat protein [Tetrahymena thermophila SB210]